MSTPNPACACGCGNEVSRPAHRYILGHAATPKMNDVDVFYARKMISAGIVQRDIARVFGVSQAIISCLKHGDLDGRGITDQGRSISAMASAVQRVEEIVARQNSFNEKKDFRAAKRELLAMRHTLRKMGYKFPRSNRRALINATQIVPRYI